MNGSAYTPVRVFHRAKPANGTLWAGRNQVAVRFDALTFHEISERASREKVSFAEMVRRLVDAGLQP